MTARTKIVATAAAVSLLGLGMAAGVAQADRKHGMHGMHGHHGMHRLMRDFAERYDTDKDGKITQEEIDANRAEWHGEFDGDKDSTLTLREFEALWVKARRERMVREFQRFDRDGDGKLTLEEYRRPLADVVERWDRNADGALSKDDRGRRSGGNSDSDDKPQGE